MSYSHRNKTRKNESGNVLFYILIAVALLAALSYAVSNSDRGSMGHMDVEKTKLATSEILEYSAVIGNAVTQLRLRGCNDTEISFENPVSVTDYENTADPTGDDTCNVFHVSGAGVQYRAPETIWLDTSKNAEDFYGEILFTAKTCIPFVGTGDVSCTSGGVNTADLIMAVPFLQKEICVQINEKLGVGIAGNDPPQDVSNAWDSTAPQFVGNYAGGVRLRDDTSEYLHGKKSGCFEADSTPNGGYHFYKVLVAR